MEVNEGKKERIRVCTANAIYTGDLSIPERRNRFSDVINDPDLVFINLTDVDVDVDQSKEKIDHVSINKHFIESVRRAE